MNIHSEITDTGLISRARAYAKGKTGKVKMSVVATLITALADRLESHSGKSKAKLEFSAGYRILSKQAMKALVYCVPTDSISQSALVANVARLLKEICTWRGTNIKAVFNCLEDTGEELDLGTMDGMGILDHDIADAICEASQILATANADEDEDVGGRIHEVPDAVEQLVNDIFKWQEIRGTAKMSVLESLISDCHSDSLADETQALVSRYKKHMGDYTPDVLEAMREVLDKAEQEHQANG